MAPLSSKEVPAPPPSADASRRAAPVVAAAALLSILAARSLAGGATPATGHLRLAEGPGSAMLSGSVVGSEVVEVMGAEGQPEAPPETLCIHAGGANPRWCCRPTAAAGPRARTLASGLPDATELLPLHRTVRLRCSVKVAAAAVASSRGRGSFDGGGRWWIERIGPFVTTGGGQQVEIAQQHPHGVPLTGLFGGSEGAGSVGQTVLTGWEFGPVGEHNEVLSYPPIHVHHVLVAGSSDRYEGTAFGGRDMHGKLLTLSATDGCATELNVTACYRGNFDGRSLILRAGSKIIYNAILNDARPAGAPPLKWWLQMAVRGIRTSPPAAENGDAVGHPVSGLSTPPYSILRFTSLAYTGGQFARYGVPSGAESFQYTSTRMPIAGEFDPRQLTASAHAHALAAQEMFLFAGTPAQLGLAEGAVHGDHCSASPRAAGYADNGAVRDHILGRVAAAANTTTATATATTTTKEAHAGDPVEKPRLICHSKPRFRWNPDHTQVFDRRPDISCAGINFTEGTAITSVSFAGPVKAPYPQDTFWVHSNWHIPFAAASPNARRSYVFESRFPAEMHSDCKIWW